MTATDYDVVAIGNAIVDVIRRCDDDFLAATGLAKGHMTLANTPSTIATLSSKLRQGMEVAGGSAANTAVGISSLGGRAAFIGKVAEDAFGRIFRHDIQTMGVSFTTPATIVPGKQTSHSLVLVTPDGQRTMNTYLGCSTDFSDAFLDAEIIGKARYVYLEGYLFDKADAKVAFHRAVEIAKSAGRDVALSLSDSLCVERHRDELFSLIRSGIGIVFANETELLALYETQNIDQAIDSIAKDTKLAVVTRSEKGAVVLKDGAKTFIPPEPVRKVVDATGAGDLYAAGFLYGMARNFSIEKAGRLASFAASEIICQLGARPEAKLMKLAMMRNILPSPHTIGRM